MAPQIDKNAPVVRNNQCLRPPPSTASCVLDRGIARCARTITRLCRTHCSTFKPGTSNSSEARRSPCFGSNPNAPGRLGAGANGLTMLPRQDMDGLIGAPYFDDCGVQYFQPIDRYIGGAGHELGHALGLPHPPGCDAGLTSCDYAALMWAGYASYPATYFRSDDSAAIRLASITSLFLSRRH